MVADSAWYLVAPGQSTRSSTAAKVRVADVLDQMKAQHRDDTVGTSEAEMLMTLTEGIISGSRSARTSRWAQVLGPIVKPGVAATLLDISTTALDKRRDSGAVLGVQTENRRWVYPLAQFCADARGNMQVRPGLQTLLTVLVPAADGLAAARWLATPNRRLDAATPWEVLANDGATPQLEAAARAQADAWTGR